MQFCGTRDSETMSRFFPTIVYLDAFMRLHPLTLFSSLADQFDQFMNPEEAAGNSAQYPVIKTGVS